MVRMKRSLVTLLLVALGASSWVGCASKRYVTKSYWHSPDTMFIAYREVQGGADEGRVKLCRRSVDNKLKCEDVEAVNTILNAEQ